MSTNSLIIRKISSGYEYIYCHWDGYPEGVGKTLNQHYTDKQKINRLFALGDLSSLESEIGKKHDFNDNNINDTWTTSYKRDREDENTQSTKTITFQQVEFSKKHSTAEYIYLYIPEYKTWLPRKIFK